MDKPHLEAISSTCLINISLDYVYIFIGKTAESVFFEGIPEPVSPC